MIKLIVSDVDGALIPGGSPDLDPEVLDIILGFREKGMQFTVASGCPRASVEGVFEPAKKKIFRATSNGAYVGCHGGCLYAYTVDRQLARHIIREAHIHPGLEMVYADVNGDYSDSKNDVLYDWLTNNYKFNVIRIRDVLELEESCMKISTCKKGRTEAATRDIYEESRDQAKIACTGSMWMDCMARDVDKGRAVCVVQKSLGIKVEETMIFGDQLNDIEMLNQTYYNFAIASTRGEVCRTARFRADNDVRDGILKILKGLLREERDGEQKQDIQETREETEKDLDTVSGSGPGADCFYRVFQEDSCNSRLQDRG